jgi:CRP/FNR family transcriptional regulator
MATMFDTVAAETSLADRFNRSSWFVRSADTTRFSGGVQVDLAGVVELLGGRPDDMVATDLPRLPLQRVARGHTLIHEAAPAHALYVVHSGSFKSVKTSEDGYEHVLGFAWRRDLIGYDGLHGGHYAFAAAALEDSRVISLPLPALAAWRQRWPALDAALQAVVARQIAHAGEIAFVMAVVSADVRLARLLVLLSARMAEAGQSPRRLLLRMSRRDMANHLGLAHETISRSLRLLSVAGLLHVDKRDVEIVDLDGLHHWARQTRHSVEEPHATLAQAA